MVEIEEFKDVLTITLEKHGNRYRALIHRRSVDQDLGVIDKFVSLNPNINRVSVIGDNTFITFSGLTGCKLVTERYAKGYEWSSLICGEEKSVEKEIEETIVWEKK